MINNRCAKYTLAIVAMTVFLVACAQREGRVAPLRRTMAAEIARFDPQLAADVGSGEVFRDLYEGLTSESSSGQIEPAAASGWNVSPDGLTYVFLLRPGLRWSNGDPVVAADFAAGLHRAVDPETASPAAELLECLVGARDIVARRSKVSDLGVRAIDDRTLEFKLAHPAPYLPALLAYPVAFPVHRASVEKYGKAFAAARTLVSNGPYVLADSRPGGALHLVRNQLYWDQRSVQISAVDFYVISDAKVELNRYRAGEIDMTSVLPAADFEWAKAALPSELQTGPELGVYFFAFNLSHGPVQSSPAVREALALALDREGIVAHALKAGQLPAYSFVPPGIAGYEPVRHDWAADDLAHRRQRARILMNSAGFNASHPLHLRLVYAQAETVRNLVIATAAQWHDVLGVEVEPEALEFRAFLARRNERQSWDVMVNGWNADYADPGNFLEVFRTGGPQYDPGLVDPAYDQLLDQAAAEADGPRRLAVYARAEQHLLAGYAVTPMYFVATRRLVKPYVHGVTLNPMNHNYTKHWSLDADARR